MAQKEHFNDTPKDNKQLVGLMRRFGAIFYDFLILLACILLITPAWTAAGIVFGNPWYPAYIVFIYLLIFFYFSWSWMHGGQTIGMKAWTIRLVSLRQTSLSWTQAISRSGIAVISLIIFGIGFLWVLFNRNKMAWHDLFSDSYLVKTK